MISIERIRNNYEVLKSSLALKGYNDDLNEIILIDRDYRASLSLVNELRAERNKVTDQIAGLKKSKLDVNDKIDSMRAVGSKIKDLEFKISEKKEKLDELILNLPNVPLAHTNRSFCSESKAKSQNPTNKPAFRRSGR